MNFKIVHTQVVKNYMLINNFLFKKFREKAVHFHYLPLLRNFHNGRCLKQNVSPGNGIYLIDENDEYVNNANNTNKYTERTRTCGELRIDHIGQQVILCGWLEYQRMNKFVILRDGYGETQLLIKENDHEIQKLFHNLPYESIVMVEGTVASRPTEMVNERQETGEIEILVTDVKVLNKATNNLAFNIREFQKAKEDLRMQFRYLDLRFPQMQTNLRTRSQMLMRMREFLVNEAQFVDVETPTLFKATPGGAQEFVVPTRIPGRFYSLVQSPQQFKQMLMAGGIDRYFQIARCYRDEGSRPDRQPEFTQLDIEMSFTNVDGVIRLIEELLQHSWPKFLKPLPRRFERISFKEAMEKYGTDKPDTRFDFKLENCTDLMEPNTSSNTTDFQTSCLIFREPYNVLSKSLKEKFATLSKQYPQIKFTQNKVVDELNWIEKMSKLLGKDTSLKIYEKFVLKKNDVIFLAFGPRIPTLTLLGKIRVEYANILEERGNKIKSDSMHMLWVVDFPLFEEGAQPNTMSTVHHPFTAPHPEDLHMLESTPFSVRSLAYDLVLNGNEIGGGSIRIHDPNLQEKIFNLLNIDTKNMQHILDMLSSGCPPHGGIALGLDRLLAVILNTSSIRDVIAFPKTFEGRDPISGAPSPITEHDKKIYHIETVGN